MKQSSEDLLMKKFEEGFKKGTGNIDPGTAQKELKKIIGPGHAEPVVKHRFSIRLMDSIISLFLVFLGLIVFMTIPAVVAEFTSIPAAFTLIGMILIIAIRSAKQQNK